MENITFPIGELSDEVIAIIFSWTGEFDLGALKQVCSRFQQIVKDTNLNLKNQVMKRNAEILAKTIDFKKYGFNSELQYGFFNVHEIQRMKYHSWDGKFKCWMSKVVTNLVITWFSDVSFLPGEEPYFSRSIPRYEPKTELRLEHNYNKETTGEIYACFQITDKRRFINHFTNSILEKIITALMLARRDSYERTKYLISVYGEDYIRDNSLLGPNRKIYNPLY